MSVLEWTVKVFSQFHRQISQMCGSENKKCSPWKVFVTNHPQIWPPLTRRGPRSPDMRLSQHYIGPKMTFCHFSTFCRKKFPGLSKNCTYLYNLVVILKNRVAKPQDSFNKYKKNLLSSWETFICRNLKNDRIFGPI